jgi:glycosyltransferase involved in cell wall biosynthesis
MAKLVRSARAQLVHFPYQTFEPVGCPFIYEPWDLQHRHLPEFFAVEEIARRDRTYRDGCEKAALVVTATHWVKQDLVAQFGLPPEKIAVIERPAFGADFRPPSSAEAAKLLRPLRLPDNYFFYPAKDFPHKNHLRLFAAIAAVRCRGLDVSLVCCGRVLDRNRVAWDRELKRLGIQHHVRLLGRVNDELVLALYAGARGLVFPSLFEGLGFPILEAMQMGLPVVTTRAACIPEVAGEAAIYVDGRSVDSLADGIAALCTNPQRESGLRRLGRKLVGRLDWRRAARDYLACYRCVSGVGVTAADESRFRQLRQLSVADVRESA